MRVIEFPPIATLKQWATKYNRETNELRRQVFSSMKHSAYDGALSMKMKLDGRSPAADIVIRELREKGYKADYVGTVSVSLEISW